MNEAYKTGGLHQHAEPEQEREWIFTFGYGQRLLAEPGYGNADPEGFSLALRFVRITGTYEGARAEMIRRFGRTWSFQYESDVDAGVVKYGMRELS